MADIDDSRWINTPEKYGLNDPRHNVYSRPDLQAFRQAIELTSSMYKVTRASINEYDEKGRPNNKEEVIYMAMSIVPVGDMRIDRKGQGTWVAESFKINYIYPDYLRGEEIIEHPNYGLLRVLSVNDMREYGVMEATAVRINSIRPVMDSGEWR